MKKYLLTLICLIIVFLLIFFFILKVDRNLTHVESLIKEPVLYVEKVVATPINFFKNKLNVLKSKNQLVNDIKKLKKIKLEKSILKNELKEKNRKIEELSNLLNININSNYKLVNANVIVRNVGLWYQTLTLDKGVKNSILKNSMVINSDGLVGLVDKTTKNTSTVKLLTCLNNEFKIGVLIENDNDIVYGILSEFKNGLFIIRGISYNKVIKKGSVVTTSGLENEMISGVNIGIVDSVSKDNFDLEQIVYVKPSVDFNRINYASIVVSK